MSKSKRLVTQGDYYLRMSEGGFTVESGSEATSVLRLLRQSPGKVLLEFSENGVPTFLGVDNGVLKIGTSVQAPETPHWQPDLLDISVPLQQLVNLGSFAGNRINLRLFPVSTYINKMWAAYGAGIDPTPVEQRFRTIRLFVNW